MSEVVGDARAQALDVDLPPSPYPGLRPFEKQEWPIFFGREAITDDIIGRLITSHVVALHGSSGSGKSSLIRAGVLPRLEQEHASSGLTWRTCAMMPGNDPLGHLAAALAELHPSGPGTETVLAMRRILNRGRDAAAQLVSILRRTPNDHLCVLVDQFEELFEFAKRERDQAALFTQVLIGVASAREGLYAILTLRSDYFGACARFFGLAELVNQTQHLLPRMEHPDLLRAVRDPADLYGGSVSRELAEQLIAEAGGDQDELPLIQHGLMLLWHVASKADASRKPPALSPRDYPEGTSLGSLLSSHADAVLQSVAKDPVAERTVEFVFRALTDINAEGHAVRRHQTFAELCAIADTRPDRLSPILDAFRAAGVSLLRPYGSTTTELSTDIDISHEALIRCWNRIADPKSGWLHKEFRDGLIWRSLLVAAESFEQDPSNVLGAVTTDERERWLKNHNEAWARRYGGGWDRVQALMAASRVARDRQRAQEDEARRLAEEGRLHQEQLQAAKAVVAEQAKRATAERQKRVVALIGFFFSLVLATAAVVLAFAQSSAREAERAAKIEAEDASRKATVAAGAAKKAEEEARHAQAAAEERLQTLLTQFGWKNPTAASDRATVQESLYANKALQVAVTNVPAQEHERRKRITLEYFPKNVDAGKVKAALSELGFTVTEPKAVVPDVPTNAIWFGSPVSLEDVKLVALTLIRAGVQIRRISPIPYDLPGKKDAALIQVGADTKFVNDPPLTVDAIQAATAFQR